MGAMKIDVQTAIVQPMMAAVPVSPAATGVKPLRSDGVEARNRLLDAALALFAEKGFAKTSTREIALAAQVNIASISYYFGDKAGLYRAVFDDPRTCAGPDAALMLGAVGPDGERVSLDALLRAILSGFTEPLKQADLSHNSRRLHFREMLDPTGVWQDVIDNNIRPTHDALVQALCAHLALQQADDDIHRLAYSITSLGVMLHLGSEILPALCPTLIATPQQIDGFTERLLGYAHAMVDGEVRRRTDAGATDVAQSVPIEPLQHSL
jgi:AcrR family transcriptional regulator